MAYKKILIAVDNSEYSRRAAKKGLELAHQLEAEAALLFVIEKSQTHGNVGTGISHEDALIVLKKEAEQVMDELTKMYSGNTPDKFMPEGNPEEDILEMAKSWKADLLVLGTHGRTGLKHLLMGSTAERVMRHSDIPVMMVSWK